MDRDLEFDISRSDRSRFQNESKMDRELKCDVGKIRVLGMRSVPTSAYLRMKDWNLESERKGEGGESRTSKENDEGLLFWFAWESHLGIVTGRVRAGSHH